VSGIKFEPGQIVATPCVLEAFRASGDDPLAYLARHLAGDWGDVDADDHHENEEFALRKLLDDQQDKSSPNYHQWLAPEAAHSMRELTR